MTGTKFSGLIKGSLGDLSLPISADAGLNNTSLSVVCILVTMATFVTGRVFKGEGGLPCECNNI